MRFSGLGKSKVLADYADKISEYSKDGLLSALKDEDVAFVKEIGKCLEKTLYDGDSELIILRPKECTECWFDYLEKYAMVSKHKIITGDFLTLNSNHPSCKSHVIIRRDDPAFKKIEPKPVVVQYHGYSLKCGVRRDTDEKKENFAMCCLIMFKPFRSIQNIKGEYDTYYEQCPTSKEICVEIF